MNARSIHHPTIHEASSSIDTHKLLSINFLENQSLLIIKGWSLRPELRVSYQVILEEIRNHLASNEGLTINFEYKLFYASTTRFLFETIKVLNRANTEGKRVSINWIAEKYSTEMYEMGMDLQGLCEFDFHVSLAKHTISPSLN